MELSFDSTSKVDSNKPRVQRSAHHSRNFEASIAARVDGLEERLIETSHTLEKILAIITSSSLGNVSLVMVTSQSPNHSPLHY